jgi:hypothetical protein
MAGAAPGSADRKVDFDKLDKKTNILLPSMDRRPRHASATGT